ncbi:UNVERIFIED_CONTAM: hypothetical protein Sindi_1256600, partial [Sesamum indicum]
RYYQYPEPHYPSMLEVWGPIMLPGVPAEVQNEAKNDDSGNTVCNLTHTHIVSWDAVEYVACGDGGPALARNTSLAARLSLDMGSKVGGIGSWTDYIRQFGMQSDRGAQMYNERDSTARSLRPQGLPPRYRDGPYAYNAHL